MASLLDQTRLLLDFNQWANDRILSAAEGLAQDTYEQLGDQFAHILETQRWWHANWTGGECVYLKPRTIADAREAYARSHDDLRAFGAVPNGCRARPP